MFKGISTGIAVAILLDPVGAFANCGDIPKALFDVEMAGARSYLTTLPDGFRVETTVHNPGNPGYPMVGGRDTLWGESQGISHVAHLTWWRDQRVITIEDSILTSSTRSFERKLEIISGIAGISFEYSPSADNYTLDCEPELSIHVCREAFPVAPTPRMILVIEHALNDAMYRDALINPDGASPAAAANAGRGNSPACRPARPDALPERGPILETRLSPAEIGQELDHLRENLTKSGASDAIIGEQLARARQYYAETASGYKTADRLSLFPEISESDELAYFCAARFVIPPVHYAYASPRTDEPGAIDIKTMGCRTAQGEMYCSLSVETALTLDDADTFFFADDSIDEAEARTVASLYLTQTGTWNGLNRISKQDDEYILQFGRRGCACSEQRLARIVTVAEGPLLELDEALLSVCT